MAKNNKSETLSGFQNLADYYRNEYSSSDIVIKPYFNPAVANMGLEKYGQAFFEGTGLAQQLRCTDVNGVLRYKTGLDEYAPEIKLIRDEKEKAAKIKQIRETVAKLELELFSTTVDPNDPSFWDKVTLAPNKPEYWEQVAIAVGNDGLYLDPNNAHDLVKIIAAESGGFDDVASSLEEATSTPRPPKLYLEKRKDVKIQTGGLKRNRDRAIATLFTIRDEAPQKLFWIVKNLLPIANSYKWKDQPDVWYGDLSSYIEGDGIEKDKKLAPDKFMRWANADQETLQIRAYVLEGAFLKHLITKSDNRVYIKGLDSCVGSNLEEAIEYLKDPLNERDLRYLQDVIDKIWSR